MLNWLPEELAQRQHDGLLRRRRTFRPLPDGFCEVDGRRVRNFASNDYLNLAHERLEQALAEFEEQPAAILFPTGMAANAGTIVALVRPEDVIFSDRLNHASLIQGCRLANAKLRLYRHTELGELNDELRRWN